MTRTRTKAARRVFALTTLISLLLVSLSACSPGPNVRNEALADSRSAIDKVSALAVENAIGFDLDGYSAAVSRGEAWPKPAFATIHDDNFEPLPVWANGASFDVSIDESGSYPKVVVSYAASGQGSAGSGFNARIARVLVCVSIGVEFIRDEVDVYVPPTVGEVTCPDEVRKYFGADEVVTLAEVLAGR